jgi:cytoskeleton protein RodZ
MDTQNIDSQVEHGRPLGAGGDSAAIVGAALAAGRAAKGLAVEDISRLLKLSVVQVNALESGDHSHLPSAVFVRGFIRSYAKLINLDLTPLLPPVKAAPTENTNAHDTRADSYDRHDRSDTPDRHLMHRKRGVSIEPSPYRRVPAILAGVACVLLGLAYYEFVFNAPPGSAPAANAPLESMRQTNGEVPDSVAVDSAVTRKGSTIDQLVLKKSSEPSIEVKGIGGRDGLHFVFNGNSWVEVRDRAGKVVYSKSNPSGTESLVRGDPPLSVVVGAASVVKLSYNGSPVDLAMHATADVARLRLE